MLTPSTAWRRLQAGNHGYAASLRSQPGPAAPDRTPAAVVFGCSDDTSAIDTVFGQDPGSLIRVSTWGHVVDTGVLATIEYAVDVLRTPLIVVAGHQHCAAMHAALDSWKTIAFPDGARRAVIEQAMLSLAQPGGATLDADQLSDAHIKQAGLSLLAKSRTVAAAVDSGQCAIVCLTTNSATGRIHTCGTLGAITHNEVPLLEAV